MMSEKLAEAFDIREVRQYDDSKMFINILIPIFAVGCSGVDIQGV